MAILALLARAGERGITREKVLSLLWPDADDERGPRTLTQAFYALRKDLGAEDAITGAKDLRLNPTIVSSDVGEFVAAVARGDDERAAALYEGPFLDGFRLPGAEEFARWLEAERASLAHDHVRILESLARAALAGGRAHDAVSWWRKLAALEPLNARVAVGLMEAMAAGGDRAGAIRYSHIYEVLVQEELDLPPDKEVMSLAQRLRQQAETVELNTALVHATEPAIQTAAAPETHAVQAAIAVEASPQLATLEPRLRSRFRWPHYSALAALLLGLLSLPLVVSQRRTATTRNKGAEPSGTVVAIGRIASYGKDASTAALAAPVADLLATISLRSRLRLVSQTRMNELMQAADTNAAAGHRARQAGAAEVIDGIPYARPDGVLRLDLRRVDLSNGAVREVQTVEGRDLFALVDSGTARLGAALGARAPAGSIADLTTVP
jgi:DNA-binding SARP family transcriptional activator